jgi:undecaprenyl diphosphate synthase
MSATTDTSAADYARAAGLDPARLPRHVAIIMDGNGRWAKAQGWERTFGHRHGASAVRAITTDSVKLGLKRLTLYAFSSENWSRPAAEIDVLMRLLAEFLRNELPTLQENGVRLEGIGRLERLPEWVHDILRETCAATANNTNLVLSLAISYGGRDEIIDACRAIAESVAAGTLLPHEIEAETVQAHLYAPTAEDVDLVIRTAGEQRLSNFLPWQATYAEFVSVSALWPEFSVEDFHSALKEYQGRERRFGAV